MLVTGGAGFIGSTLVDRLLAEGHTVDVVDDLSTGSLANLSDARAAAGHQLTVHQMDVRSPEVVELMGRRRPEVVFHLAAQADVRVSVADPVFDADVNMLGTLRVLEGARLAGTGRVVFAASGGTLYGEPDASELPLKESLPHRPLSPYGVSKKAAIDYLVAYREMHALEFSALALANVYGPRQDPHGEAGVVAIFAERLLRGEQVTIFGDGEQTRDFVYVDDVVDAFVRAATKGGGLLCNIGTGQGDLGQRALPGDGHPGRRRARRRASAPPPGRGPAQHRRPDPGGHPARLGALDRAGSRDRGRAGLRPETQRRRGRGLTAAAARRPLGSAEALAWSCPGAPTWRQAIPPRHIPVPCPVARKHPMPPLQPSFASLGVPSDIVAALERKSITEPFPIQSATIPDALAGRDVCGKAPTGSGKTLAFGIGAVGRLTGKPSRPKHPRVLVLTPTRELAAQVATELRALATPRNLRVDSFYGGVGYGPQLKALSRGVDVAVACPGRLGDLIERGSIRLDAVEIVVIDEADRMADMGFLPDVRRILDLTPSDRQTLLFSATLDGDIDVLVRRYQHDPSRHELEADEDDTVAAVHLFWKVQSGDRVARTADVASASGPTIVFCRTKHGTDRIARQLEQHGVRAAAIHGDRSQKQREKALDCVHPGRGRRAGGDRCRRSGDPRRRCERGGPLRSAGRLEGLRAPVGTDGQSGCHRGGGESGDAGQAGRGQAHPA